MRPPLGFIVPHNLVDNSESIIAASAAVSGVFLLFNSGLVVVHFNVEKGLQALSLLTLVQLDSLELDDQVLHLVRQLAILQRQILLSQLSLLQLDLV